MSSEPAGLTSLKASHLPSRENEPGRCKWGEVVRRSSGPLPSAAFQ